MRFFYRPAYIYFFIDVLILLLSYYVVLDWFPLTSNSPFDKYSLATLYYTLAWIVISYFLKRYKPLRRQQYFNSIVQLFYVSAINFTFFWLVIHNFYKPYSGFVLLAVTVGVFIVNYLFHSLYFAYRFAVEYNELVFDDIKERKNAQVKTASLIDEDSYTQLISTIRIHSGPKIIVFLQNHINLKSGNTKVFVNTKPENLMMYPNYLFSAIVQLERLNNMREVNRKLFLINEKLPDNGLFVCCFESKSTRKKRIFERFPPVINYILYSLDFLFKRVMPKIFITQKLYYFITGGKNRIFSKTEILGRLYCFGFKIKIEKKIGDLTYIIAQRAKQPEIHQKRIYGPLIRLRRLGKAGKFFNVYKMRTMHPYSEYLQGYIFDKNSLKEGGKFKRDIRITSMGRFMRKYWLDELPMILNLLKGEMKLVGVRPLSKHYYSLYSNELQEKRIRHKPGLLPPFYADMPKTLEEIQESEMTYLNLCETKGTLLTDLRYLIRIIKNILFHKARSS